MKIKTILYFTGICIIFLCNTNVYAQNKNDSINPTQTDTPRTIAREHISTPIDTLGENERIEISKINKTQKIAVNTPQKNKKPDSLLVNTQNTTNNIDATKNNLEKDTSKEIFEPKVIAYRSITNELLLRNKFINVKDAPAYFIEQHRNVTGKEFLFYMLCIIVLLLGIFKTFYRQYFNNLFRVFFNTSLRQTQLTDQLLLAKLPSFILNIFFTLSAGVYIWLLFTHFHPPRLISNKLLLPFCILSVALVYFLKFCLLKFIGWVSDVRQATDNYIFVIFLINKITGILLVPIIILLAFSMPGWINTVAMGSLLILGLFFLSRYIKSYGVIDKKIPLNLFHFIIYIIGAEIIPLLILYKVAIDYLI